MAALVDNAKIIVPFMPTLVHLARVKVAASLLNYDYKTLEKVFGEIQSVNSSESNEDFEENGNENYNKAKEELLNIPGHLRKSVLEAVKCMQYVGNRWRNRYSKILLLKDRNFTLHWRSDGSVDAHKIAEELVLNGNIDIKKRFEIASSYCFEKRIQDLWAEMEASGETENFETDNFLARFWVRWMRDGAKVPWTHAAGEYLEPPNPEPRFIPRFSCFFPLLQPEDRQKFLRSITLYFTSLDDFRFCLYSSTREEENEIMKKNLFKVLLIHLCWPLQSLFLETIEKMWEYIDINAYWHLHLEFDKRDCMKCHIYDLDEDELFIQFWKRSPDVLKESVTFDRGLNRIIHLRLKKIERKRKAVDHERTEPKKRRLKVEKRE